MFKKQLFFAWVMVLVFSLATSNSTEAGKQRGVGLLVGYHFLNEWESRAISLGVSMVELNPGRIGGYAEFTVDTASLDGVSSYGVSGGPTLAWGSKRLGGVALGLSFMVTTQGPPRLTSTLQSNSLGVELAVHQQVTKDASIGVSYRVFPAAVHIVSQYIFSKETKKK